jgi:hypothetical protein
MQDSQTHSRSAMNGNTRVMDMEEKKDIGQLVEKKNVGDEYTSRAGGAIWSR